MLIIRVIKDTGDQPSWQPLDILHDERQSDVGGYILNLILAHVVPKRLPSVAQRDHGLLVSRSLQNTTSVHLEIEM